MEAPIITLTSDWGDKDFFTGMVKGRLYSNIPNVRVVDISHGIEPFDIARATFVVRQTCLGFPKNTIHIIDINSVADEYHPFVIVEYDGQYFICNDNGLPFSVFGNEADNITHIPFDNVRDTRPFVAYDLLCGLAIQLANGKRPSDLGKPWPRLTQSSAPAYIVNGDRLIVYISYIDNYGNAYLNITYPEFEKIRAGRNFVLNINHSKINSISHSYGTRGTGLILIVSSTGHLHVAIRNDSAEQLLGLKVQGNLEFVFKD